MRTIAAFIGGYGLASIIECGGNRFEFADLNESAQPSFDAFVFEAFDADGETVIDLVSWRPDEPSHVLSMFGRCGLVGLWEAMGPATYFMGGFLTMHRTPLDSLKAGCKGAAVVTSSIAARQLVDIPGRVAARDQAHGRQLSQLLQSVVDPNKIIVPSRPWRAAA